MNKVILLGRTTRDVELKTTQSGLVIGAVTLAVKRSGKQNDGEAGADFIFCTSFGKTAENMEHYVKRGQQIVIEGKLRNDSWKDAEGKTQSKTGVTVDQFYFAESKKETAAPTHERIVDDTPAYGVSPGGYKLNEDDEDLPF